MGNRITRVKPGDTIRIVEKEKDECKRINVISRVYTVVEVYRNFVLAREKGTRTKRSISFADLITLGLERQSPEIEAKRYEVDRGSRK